MSSKSYVLRSSGLYMLGQLVQQGLGFVFVALATRILGIRDYGLYALSMTIFSVMYTFGLWGLQYATQRCLSGDFTPAHRAKFGAMLTVNVLSSLTLGSVMVLGNHLIAAKCFTKPELSPVLKVTGLALYFALPLNLGLSLLRAQHRAGEFLILEVLRMLLRLGCLGLVFALADNLIAVSLTTVLSSAAALALCAVVLARHDIIPVFSNWRESIREVYRYGSVLFVTGSAYLAVGHLDRLMLGCQQPGADRRQRHAELRIDSMLRRMRRGDRLVSERTGDPCGAGDPDTRVHWLLGSKRQTRVPVVPDSRHRGAAFYLRSASFCSVCRRCLFLSESLFVLCFWFTFGKEERLRTAAKMRSVFSGIIGQNALPG